MVALNWFLWHWFLPLPLYHDSVLAERMSAMTALPAEELKVLLWLLKCSPPGSHRWQCLVLACAVALVSGRQGSCACCAYLFTPHLLEDRFHQLWLTRNNLGITSLLSWGGGVALLFFLLGASVFHLASLLYCLVSDFFEVVHPLVFFFLLSDNLKSEDIKSLWITLR